MSQATYIRDMMTEPASDLAADPSEIASFYAGRNVLITGATGFLGNLLIERILRSCPKVNTLFLLVRAKKGKSPEERFRDLFDDVIFDRMKRERPMFAQKVVLIEGDMAQVDLGLSLEHREQLRNTHIVVHGAATVRFDEKIRIAVSINVRGLQKLLSLAKEMVDLKAFVYISTAFSNCVLHYIEEKYYSPPIDYDKLLSLIDILDDAYLDHLTPKLVGKWPNTYAFTKAVAEDVIRNNCQGLPLCIVRPSIVIATSKEPIAGWINNVYGPTGAFAGAAVGLLRTLHCDGDMVADVIPADYVVNSIIVAAWDTAKTHSQKVNSAGSSMVPRVEEPPTIYNVVSSAQRPVTWGQLKKFSEEFGLVIPPLPSIWYYFFTYNKNRWIHNLYVIFLHLIPAAIVDSLAWLTGRKPRLWATYKNTAKYESAMKYFTLQQWQFDDKNFQQLWKRMGPTDCSEFDLDIGNLNWKDYFYSHIRGIRVYLLKDPLDTVPQALAKQAKLKIAHYTILTAVCGILIWILWTVWRFIGLW